MIKTMTVTQLRKEIFDVVEAAKVNQQITDIMLHGKVVASLVPKEVEKFDWNKYRKDLKKACKILGKHNWSDVEKIREESKVDRFSDW